MNCRSDNRYLQVYDERWGCWLFPYYRSTKNNLANLDQKISEQLHLDISTSYVTHTKHCKYSVSDEVYKIYHHKLYQALLEGLPENMKDDEFELEERKYKWMSIAEMEKNPDIMEKNDDIVAFVKMKCGKLLE